MSVVNLDDVEAAARERLPAAAADYIAGGAEDEVTLRANRQAFEALVLRPRVLVDVSTRSLETAVLGQAMPMPVLIAPTGFQRLAHPDGELATARAAGAEGVCLVLSTFSTASLEEVAAAGGPRWFQLYVHRDRGLTADLVRRAEAAGYSALVLTVDLPVLGRRERDLRNGFSLPTDLRLGNFALATSAALHGVEQGSALAAFHEGLRDPAFTWEDVDWLRSVSRLPLILKGVLRADDARRGVDHGAAGIIVSNHGGRQLDGAASGIGALPEVVEAVGGEVEVLVDGGVRRGVDVVRALAVGARAVLIGRPVLWGLAWDGEAGVRRVLRMLRDELDTAMALVGAPTVRAITRDLLA